MSVEVTDQDAALAYYVDVLGCELRTDVEVFPGGRWVEVVPPGSTVGIALVTRESGIPVALRLGTSDADEAHARLTSAGTAPHQAVIREAYAPPMFAFDDPDGNALVYLEDAPG
ncbi:VOC family protein [Cellulomonas alba]|uniref:VOC family protein n=1 Tax=Cellulomonas alba TaxID=3053467 RepID=A0ABT7SBA1_9CELL|nr:VOC family protein [Cellulomonas alba]MDM7853455.1 VOC family protein [Cellulomonas alba]